MSAVETYHRLTSFATAKEEYPADPRLRNDFEPLVKERFPAPVKGYPDGLPVVELPVELPAHPVAAADVLSGRRPADPAGLDLGEVARLLFWSAGVVRYIEREDLPRPMYLHAAGSAGNLHPLDLYVVAVGVAGLADGVWYHDPVRHRLRRVGDGPASGPTYLVVTGVPWRTGWKYTERGWRHIWWDAGTMLSQTLALADAAGLPAALWLNFPDAEVTRLVGADGVQEFPVALVSLAAGRPELAAAGAPAVAGVIDTAPEEFPLVTAAQRATDRTAWAGPARAPELPELTVPAGVGADPLEDVIRRRGSTRGFTPGATVPADVVRWSLAAATRPFRTDAGPLPITHHVFVHAVDGLEAGLHTWAPDDKGGELALVRAGDVTDEAYELCVRQGLGADGSYTVQHCATLDAMLGGPSGERGYRIAQLAAGIVEGRLHLAAFAAGHGASGMTFVDGLIERTLGVATEGLLTTCVGVPSYRGLPGGTPGRPRRLTRLRRPRFGDVD
jgi:hypothetical protein